VRSPIAYTAQREAPQKPPSGKARCQVATSPSCDHGGCDAAPAIFSVKS
jgi:hypothetical protein